MMTLAPAPAALWLARLRNSHGSLSEGFGLLLLGLVLLFLVLWIVARSLKDAL